MGYSVWSSKEAMKEDVEDEIAAIRASGDLGLAIMFCVNSLSIHKSSYEWKYLKRELEEILRRETNLKKVYAEFESNFKAGAEGEYSSCKGEWEVSQILGKWLHKKDHPCVQKFLGHYTPINY